MTRRFVRFRRTYLPSERAANVVGRPAGGRESRRRRLLDRRPAGRPTTLAAFFLQLSQFADLTLRPSRTYPDSGGSVGEFFKVHQLAAFTFGTAITSLQ